MFYQIIRVLVNGTNVLICVVSDCGIQVNADQGFSNSELISSVALMSSEAICALCCVMAFG